MATCVRFTSIFDRSPIIKSVVADPTLAPSPPSVEPTLLVLDRGSPGLFGPRSPRDSPHILPGEAEESGWGSSTADSWPTSSTADSWGT
jgi:hypothetical protein